MAIYGLFLESRRCPDGVELVVPALNGPLIFRDRTDRREPVRLEIQNLENPVVVEFVNARTDAELAEFFLKYGLPDFTPSNEHLFKLENIHIQQGGLRIGLEKAGGSSQVDALQTINQHGAINLQPIFDLAGEGGAPRMLLKCKSLTEFMLSEIAMVAVHGAKFAECDHCHKVFLTGALTGRRSHSKYCSDRCRVAAMRLRRIAEANAKIPSLLS
jgi:hypothetical protein